MLAFPAVLRDGGLMSNSIRVSIAFVVVSSACGISSSGRTAGGDVAEDPGTALQCSSSLTCSAPSSASKQTICGQIYDLETNAPLAEGPVGTPCTAVTASGACSLAIEAYDAIAFGTNPSSAPPVGHGAIEVDTCGRFRIPDVDVSAIGGPFVGLVVDDATGRGTAGTTVPVAVALPKVAGTASSGVETWIARESTVARWSYSRGPALSEGVFVPIFRAHQVGTAGTDPFELQSGVTVTRGGSVTEGFYFGATALERATVDAAAAATGANGTVLVRNASISEAVVYGGDGGLETGCRWAPHAGMSLPHTVFVQIFRPTNVIGETCAR